ncbi:hypothetical protein [Microbulbifer thermotolerans]|uniref:Uncharacterized protein n=1 Tax=Microbulbifer thermotolerans TaxID=252514 RepID=A0A143HIL9_MICTH|nr:hypothetical protein [Microbulbifer thermotolerans]AMX01564.1 hypothetical protein A3224_02310 [Microbulbifer thermotolerans]MCX2780165.1 hypothetical protein [Microbulbifer thermotolerans]MCX2784579.1 hypothetical protein [Microbulbifer thermotolerans]MCX2796447.1 hypothetical protein [Microbulbifer thermotolerans]MCX2803296.1 hypothetical protein [Microbulbifer thermotolerans]
MSFSDREKQLIRAAFTWGQITHKEGYTLSDLEIEKSVLFRRLLDGRPPLAFPPPLRHGFPWYEVIEGRGEHVVNASDPSPECSIIAPGSKPGDTCILIDGAFWRVAETVREREEYIVEWGQYPIQWRLKKHWEVNYEMTQQLHNFRKDNPNAEITFDNRSGQKEYSEFRIDDEQTVWLSEWKLSRIGLSGWVWVGRPVEMECLTDLVPLFHDQQGPLIIGEVEKLSGEAWLRIEQAGEEYRFIKLGEQLDYQPLISTAMTEFETLLREMQGDTLDVMDWRGERLLRRYLVPSHLAPLEEFELQGENYDLMPENAY